MTDLSLFEVFDLDELRKKLSPRQAGLFGDAT